MTSTAFAPLLAPAIDDSMEVSSSPAGNQYDDEVLIDYDEATYTEDEHMVEDGEPQRPGTATDDMMEDAEPSAAVKEEIMHDDPVDVAPDSYIQDEELIDYSDEDYQDDTPVTLDDATAPPVEIVESNNSMPAHNVSASETVDEAVVQQPGKSAAVEEPTAHFLSAVEENPASTTDAGDEAAAANDVLEHEEAEVVEQDDAANELSRQVDAEKTEEAAAQELGVQAFEADELEVKPIDSSEGQQVSGEAESIKKPPKFPIGLDTTAYFAADGPQTPSDTGIHPITVRYGDIVMPLFKSRVQPDGLLKDDNLASVSLGDLLDNCRHRLAVKIGESVSTDQELVLSFENMGLQIIEHSPHAFETSLDDVLEVYLSLHRNDSTQAIPPLALSLSLQLKFTSSFNILKAAAQQGEGMSKFAYLRSSPDELDEYEEEDEEEGREEGKGEQEAAQEEYKDDVGEKQHYEGEDAAAEDHADGEASHLEEGQEYDDDQHQEDHESEHEYDADQSYEDHQDEANYEEFEEQHETDASGEQAHQGNDDQPVEDGSNAHNETHDALNEDKSAHETNDFTQSLQEQEDPVQPDSAASSTTVRGDVANDSTGEYYYNDDYIDFDSDDLTAYASELHVEDGNDDLSALAGEYDVGEAVTDATAFDDDQKTVAADVTVDAVALESNADDTLNEQFTEALDGEESVAPDETSDEAGNNAEQHGQDQNPHDDNLDLNEDDLPVEEDEQNEQFDTAFDLLEDHDFEHASEDEDPFKANEGLEFDEDDIGFNDDVEEAGLAPNSPLGKRSFDEHVDGDNVVEEQQESKRPRF